MARRRIDPFVHLRVASAYSLRFGASFPDALVRRAAELGMDRLALTDRDGLYGMVKHVQACKAADIRPIAGVDLALAELTPDQSGARVTVLAKTGGWGALCRLVTAAHDRERRSPAVTAEVIQGPLVVLLGPDSDFGRAVAERRYGDAERILYGWRAAVQDPRVEVVNHYGSGDARVAARMLRLARQCGVPAVLTNKVRHLGRVDASVTHVLDASRQLISLDAVRREGGAQSAEAFLKSGPEMTEVAARTSPDDTGDLMAATRELAEECELDPHGDLGLGVPLLPAVDHEPIPWLRRRCQEGLGRRGLERSQVAKDRLRAELNIIESKQLSGYFISVAGIAHMIREAGIRCAIRGSGAGSLVNHLIGISEINPLDYGLLMERFLSEGRIGLPDIDLDVESARRLDAYRLIYQRYGEASVACVSMMETYRARSAIRDVGSAMGLPPAEVDVLAKAFPHIRARNIRSALQDLPELRRSNVRSGHLDQVFELAEKLDGLPRHIAMHPCGVLVGDPTLRARTPVEPSLDGFPMSQFDKDDVEEVGLLKLDVLGVRMQSAIAHSVAEISRTAGAEIDIEAVPRDDRATYDMIRTGHTLGCFQIESPGQRELVAKLEPADMHDLIVDISLFRPGPVNSDMVTPYLHRRHGWQAAKYAHQDLREALDETQGVVVFHEQVLKIIDIMTGCGLSEAEKARRTLACDDGRERVRRWFLARVRSCYDRQTVAEAWRVLEAFGAFGFCKAHAAAFAVPTYQSAWLKRHHPAAFFAGILTHDPGMYPPRVLVDDARHCGVEILPLDVSVSGKEWLVASGHSSPAVRVPVSAVKGISEAETERIVAAQPYTSLPDFWHRARPSRPVAERIAEVGGFDGMYGIRVGAPRWRPGRVTRRDLVAQVGALSGGGPSEKKSRRIDLPGGQLPMGFAEELTPGEFPEMSEAEAVKAELEVFGIDVSRHIVSFHDEFLDALGIVRSKDLLKQRNGSDVLVAGVKIATQTPAIRSGQRIIFATLDDSTGPVDLTFFESVQGECAATVFGSWLLVARGVIRRTGAEAVSLRAVGCWDLFALETAWKEGGLAAVHAAMKPSGDDHGVGGRKIRYSNGYELSPYSDVGVAGPATPPRRLWHASPGSSGG